MRTYEECSGDGGDPIGNGHSARGGRGADGKIEVVAHELAPGQRVTVTIQPEESPVRNLHMLHLIEQSPGQRLFETAEEVDACIRQERDSWARCWR
jgi:hypothetical protein